MMRTMSLVMLTFAVGVGMLPSSRVRAGAAEVYQQSYALEAQQDFRGALATLQSAPSAERNKYVFQLRTGWLCYLVGKLDESVAAYRRAVGQAPKALEPRLGLLLPLMAARRWEETVNEAQALLRLDPKSYLGRSRFAFALYSLGRFENAEGVYRDVLTDYPADVEMLTGLGWAQLKQEKRAEATRTFRAVLEFVPANASAREGLRLSNNGH